MTTKKSRQQALAAEIRRSNDGNALAIKQLLGLLVDDAKDNLVSSVGETTLRLQGEAQALTRLLAMLTVEPPSIARKGD
jgi:hypothetical protein